MSDHTVKRMREWGESLEREHKGGLGESLLEYAEAWEKQLAERDAALARCVEALQPFSHADLCEELGGNMQGEASPVFSRNKAILTIGDFRKAATAAASIPTSAKAAAEEQAYRSSDNS